MVKLLLLVWLSGVAAIAAAFWGDAETAALQRRLEAVTLAHAAESRGEWAVAERAYESALQDVAPGDRETQLRLKLARCIARIHDEQLPQMRTEMAALLASAQSAGVSAPLQEDIRFALAKAGYDLAWQLRRCGAAEELWREAAGSACDHFQVLVCDAMALGSPRTLEFQRDLESAVNLVRADLTQLSGLPLPSNCWSNSNCEAKAMRERHKRGGKKPGDSQRPGQPQPEQPDARDTMSAGAGSGAGQLGW